ncbi:MAG: DinB family protein [Gemmatimonadetes bacterium]|nr:DinB family protein [Gemmatimonadota bacterium]
MADLDSALKAQRTAADAFKAAAVKVPDSVWNVPRAPGKWSPAQVTDHVGVSTKVVRDAIAEKGGMGGIPRFIRWLPRKLFFDKVIAKGFPKTAKGPPAFAPAHEPKLRPDLVARIDAELDALDAEVRAMAASGKTTFEHTFFGRIAVADYVMFNAYHLDHHREQLPAAT